MTGPELILICALLAWTAFAFAIVVLLEVAVSRRTPRVGVLASELWSEDWRELVPPRA